MNYYETSLVLLTQLIDIKQVSKTKGQTLHNKTTHKEVTTKTGT